MSISLALVFRQFSLLFLCIAPLLIQVSAKEAPLDLSIIKQRDALRPHMDAQQRLDYVKAAELIKAGQSDVRSGQNLKQQKPSALDPNRDIKSIHERGERLEQAGRAEILEGQQQMVAILTAVQTKQTAARAAAAKKYNFELPEKDYQTAFETAASRTLEACRDAGYSNVFFDGIRIIQGQKNTKAGSTIHNATYDSLIHIDGTQFSVKLPLELNLQRDETTATLSFHYDNAAVFEGEKVALLAIELIAPGDGVDALLSLRALDLNSHQLISSELYYIENASEVLTATIATATTEESAATEAETASMPPITPRVIPDRVTINDHNQLIDKLAGLAKPYQFETLSTATTIAQASLVNALLKDTLLKNSSLVLVESDFILRSYLPEGASSDDFLNTATAALTVTQSEDRYIIAAEAYGTGRSLEVGDLALHAPE